MLKKRVIISLLLNDGELYRTKQFVPDYQYTQNFVTVDSIDELFIIDITRGGRSEKFGRYVKSIVDNCFVPITVGGHFRTMDDIHWALHDFGADCILMGSAVMERPKLITEIAHKFGSQLITVVCDYRMEHGRSQTYSCQGQMPQFYTAPEWARAAENLGAGQIFLQSIDRDGSLQGYDLQTLREVSDAVNIPVVVGGGCGNWSHMKEAWEAHASGSVTTNIFHMTETTISNWKLKLQEAGVPVRVE